MDRLLLTVALLAVCVLAGWGLLLGWRHRAARQDRELALPEMPAVPEDPGPDLVNPLPALYVSTTPHGRWQDRVVVRGLGRRAAATLHWTEAGVLVDRVAEPPFFLPAAALVGVDTGPGIAGKVMGRPDGLLVLTWRLGDTLLDSGFRADETEIQDSWLDLAERKNLKGASA